jgi:hypothetical protein
MFTDAYNWCDSRCERCPLQQSCPVALREAQRRWVHQARGEDPDDWSVVMDDVGEELARTLTLLHEVAEREGIDVSDEALKDTPPASLASRRLSRAGLDLVGAVRDAFAAIDEEPSEEEAADAGELVQGSALIARKAARLALALEPDEEPLEEREVWRSDWVPNLILVAQEIARARRLLDRLFGISTGRASVEKPLVVIERTLAPLEARIPPDAREEIATRIAEGRAPSPFAVLADSADESATDSANGSTNDGGRSR